VQKYHQKLMKLSQRLGYEFNHLKLLQQALTHRSVLGPHNERLEFLGDAILNFVIGERLFQSCEYAQEGELSRLRASLVRGQTLAEIAKELQLGNYLILGSGELKSGGSQRESILADAVEAIIAAVYLDGGFEAAKKIILDWFSERLSDLSTLKQKDPKTRLQEYLQSKGYMLPEYHILSIEGEAHHQIFRVRCVVSALALSVEGEALSRRRAEQCAAEAMLAMMIKKKGDK
jgi:ribonuclease III